MLTVSKKGLGATVMAHSGPGESGVGKEVVMAIRLSEFSITCTC